MDATTLKFHKFRGNLSHFLIHNYMPYVFTLQVLALTKVAEWTGLVYESNIFIGTFLLK